MDRTPLGGVSQSRRLPCAQTGDVDRDGEIVDELRRRLDGAIGDTAGLARDDHLERVLFVCTRARGRAEA